MFSILLVIHLGLEFLGHTVTLWSYGLTYWRTARLFLTLAHHFTIPPTTYEWSIYLRAKLVEINWEFPFLNLTSKFAFQTFCSSLFYLNNLNYYEEDWLKCILLGLWLKASKSESRHVKKCISFNANWIVQYLNIYQLPKWST